LELRIEGVEMPGLTCAPADADERYGNVHVGVQRLGEVVDLYPGDATKAEWSFEVTLKELDGGMDFGGPFVHGRRGDRFVYLSWGAVDGDGFRMFRRAKLHFADIPPEVLASATETGALRARVVMSDRWGNPRCARVRPPDAVWTSAGS
jgi:Family of unknown function (DUF5990)